MSHRKWWEDAIIYQIYPRSFNDSNGDGIGDINGIIEKLDYIESLGVNTVWVNPMILSNQQDNGYDVINYTKVDPIFGTEEDGERLIKEIKGRGIKIIFDFPLNHTSVEHPWFQEALKGTDNSYRDYYIWTGAEDDRPYPNNWTAAFGGSAWTKELNGDQYFLHLFMQSMAELNWEHPPLRKEMADVLNYWIERGIDGFRLDAFIYLDIDMDFPEHPEAKGAGQDLNEHGDRIKDYLNEMNDAISRHEKEIFFVGEATSADAELTQWYTDPENNMVDKIITMQYFPENKDKTIEDVPESNQHLPLDLKKFKKVQKEFQEKEGPRGGPILFWSNHDMPRSLHKYGSIDTSHRDNAAKMMATLLYLQKGIPIIYNGEEIGMKNAAFDDPGNIADSGIMDFYQKAEQAGWNHKRIMSHINLTARDVSRGIMQWDDSEKVGFTDGVPWMLYNREGTYNVRDQEQDEDSILNFYRELISLKKTELFQKGSYDMKETKDTLYVYGRTLNAQKALVCCNFSEEMETIEIGEGWQQNQIVLQNDGSQLKDDRLQLSPYGAVVLLHN
ncbi:alpha-glucosidase [Salinicoccus hispanicus]|uniref:Alpha-glucosidase n=1 Tax=Salinicoccus hispanicus TaxID=157225 RepID=A0A6N8U1J3_9STAP|nr:alpha-glucosidase [Salinicoccus hispanicus]MXQ51632.1 alpha-glucosidase [Salinicoccus hispanicus]